MKSFKVLIALASLALASVASAQTYAPATAQNIMSVYPVTAATTVTNCVLDVRRSENVGLQLDFALGAAGTSNIVVTLSKSVDGATFSSTSGGRFTWTIAGAGTATVTVTTNLVTTGLGYLKVESIDNGDDSYMTNVVLKYSIKNPAK